MEVGSLSQIGKEVEFNGVKMDSLDGFLRNKESCVVLLPELIRGSEIVSRACVLSSQYSF